MKNEWIPQWVRGNGQIDEPDFCADFLLTRDKMVHVDGAFFTCEGRVVDEERLRKDIYDHMKPYVTSNVAKKVNSILATLRLVCHGDRLDADPNVIHVANGTYHLDQGFKPEREICRHRLPVQYLPNSPNPHTWLDFLDQLLEPEDIDTLQEFMGYCLIPTTAAQKMLIITGRGGEGKSRIGVVMRALLGENMNTGSIAKVEHNPFARADLQHSLMMVDDDLRMEALKQTNNLKSLITAELPMDLERKGVQSYQGSICVRFLAFGNATLQALHDRSDGFFRRQIILSAKPRDPGRVDDPFLGKKLAAERDAIFLWALTGLYRLRDRNYRFTISEKTRQNIRDAMAEGNNLLDFLRSEGYFRFDPEGTVSARALYEVYRDWCDDNNIAPLGTKTVSSFLKQNHLEYGLSYTSHVPIGNGKYARGFKGIRLCSRI